MSSTEGMMESTDAGIDLWRVQLMTGEVRAMSLDALDDAFQSGLIMESTPVLPPGATAWTKLADAAGLDAAPPAEPTVPSLAPLAVSVSAESTGDATPYSRTPAEFMLADIDTASLDDDAFKPKRGRMFAVIGIAVVLVGGLGFGASRLNISGAATSSLSAGGPSLAPPPAAVDVNEAAAAAAAKTLTDEQKAKLAEADKAREAREAQKRKDRPPPPVRRGPQPKSATPFVNGGNKYDPLNGAL